MEQVADVARVKEPAGESPTPKRPTILIVDDEAAIREVLRYLFELRGFGVLEAEDGETAAALLGNTPVDLVVLDLVMPGMSGEEILEFMRSKAETRDLPVVILSARPDAENLPAVQQAQAIVYKPFDLLELEALTRRLLV